MYKKALAIGMIALLFLSACPKTKQLENMGIINTRGTDLVSDESNTIETTLIVFQFDPQSKSITKTLYGKGNTIKAAREDANRSSSFTLTPGQIRLELFGKELAEKGIVEMVSALVRDARVSDTMLLAVTNHTAKEVLTKGQQVTTINVGQYLHGVLQREYDDQTLPKVALQDFAHIYSDPGIDPVLPIIGFKRDEPVKTSIALFQGDRYVEELSLKDGFLINLFQERIKNAPLSLKLPLEPFKKYMEHQDLQSPVNDENLFVRLGVKGKSKTKLTDFEKKHFQTDIKIKVIMDEVSELISMKDEKAGDLLEKEIGKKLEKNYETLLKKTQEAGADPFGFGNIYGTNRKAADLTKKEWHEIYPSISVDFNVHVELLNYGTIK